MTSLKTLEEKLFSNPKVQEAYDGMEEEFKIASAIIRARDFAGISQTELAERMEAKQSLIARLESGAGNTTIKTLQRIASATGTRLNISFE